jgi:ankyrin repeat protein
MDIHQYCRDINIKLDELKNILSKDNVNIKNDSGSTPLHFLCKNQSITFPTLEFAVQNFGDVNIKSNYGWTPLYTLCMNPSITFPMLEFVVQNGGDVNIKNNSGLTPMYWLLYWNKSITKKQIQKIIKNKNVRTILTLQLLRYTICGPIILDEIFNTLMVFDQ